MRSSPDKSDHRTTGNWPNIALRHLSGNRVYQALTDAQSIKLFAEMRQIVLRGLGGILGLFAAIAAVMGPILFISNSLNEAASVRQNGGHFSLTGAIGGSLAALVLAGLFAFLAFTLLRFALRGHKAIAPFNSG
jgi:hypothetical protein